jgi:hypothetical protein
LWKNCSLRVQVSHIKKPFGSWKSKRAGVTAASWVKLIGYK